MFNAIRNYINRRGLTPYFHECDRLLVERYGLTDTQSYEVLGKQTCIEIVAVAWQHGLPAHTVAATIAFSIMQERLPLEQSMR